MTNKKIIGVVSVVVLACVLYFVKKHHGRTEN